MSDTQLQERPELEYFPTGDEYERLLTKKQRRALMVRVVLLAALATAVLALVTLIYTIIDDSFGMVAQVNQVEPEDIVASRGYDPTSVSLGDLPKDELVEVLASGISNNVGRRLEREQRFYDDRLVFETQAKWDEVCARQEDRPTGCDGPARDQQKFRTRLLG